MSGLKTYDAAEFKKAPNESMQLDSMDINDQHIPSTDELIAEMQNNRDEVAKKRNAIIQSIIMPVLDERGLRYKSVLDGDITEGSAEVVDTGSTGRYSNAPHDGDFDFMMKLDRAIRTNSSRMSEVRDELLSLMGKDGNSIDGNGNIRAKDVKLDGLDEPVDVDITFEQKTNKVKANVTFETLFRAET